MDQVSGKKKNALLICINKLEVRSFQVVQMKLWFSSGACGSEVQLGEEHFQCLAQRCANPLCLCIPTSLCSLEWLPICLLKHSPALFAYLMYGDCLFYVLLDYSLYVCSQILFCLNITSIAQLFVLRGFLVALVANLCVGSHIGE